MTKPLIRKERRYRRITLDFDILVGTIQSVQLLLREPATYQPRFSRANANGLLGGFLILRVAAFKLFSFLNTSDSDVSCVNTALFNTLLLLLRIIVLGWWGVPSAALPYLYH